MARRPAHLRPPGSDDLGLRRAMSDRLLPMLVGSMAFLAALALAGVVAAASLAHAWQQGAAAAVTVQVPDPETDQRLARVLRLLRAEPAVRSAQPLNETELATLLRPWLGAGPDRIALPLPAVIAVHLAPQPFGTSTPDTPALDAEALASRLEAEAPGTLVEAHELWIRRLAVLARSLQACAGLAMAVVAFVAVAVVTVATRAGLAARRDAIEIVHGLGANDGFIAGRFARRATRLAALGGIGGTLLAMPVLLGLTGLAAPFGGAAAPEDSAALLAAVPQAIWLGLPALPLAAAAIGWLTAQATVRRWLRRLP